MGVWGWAEWGKGGELGGLLGLEPVGLMIGRSGLGWFGHVERKEGGDWVGRCVTWEVEGIGGPGGIMLRMTWRVWACPRGMHSPGIDGKGELRGQPANPGSPGKMAVKTECVCVCVCR